MSSYSTKCNSCCKVALIDYRNSPSIQQQIQHIASFPSCNHHLFSKKKRKNAPKNIIQQQIRCLMQLATVVSRLYSSTTKRSDNKIKTRTQCCLAETLMETWEKHRSLKHSSQAKEELKKRSPHQFGGRRRKAIPVFFQNFLYIICHYSAVRHTVITDKKMHKEKGHYRRAGRPSHHYFGGKNCFRFFYEYIVKSNSAV